MITHWRPGSRFAGRKKYALVKALERYEAIAGSIYRNPDGLVQIRLPSEHELPSEEEVHEVREMIAYFRERWGLPGRGK